MTKILFAAFVMGIASNGAVAEETKQPAQNILNLLSPVTVMAENAACNCSIYVNNHWITACVLVIDCTTARSRKGLLLGRAHGRI
jgi:hypothetical protein